MSRRWLQFSLRGFLLATTAFAIWLGLVVERAERQKEAVTSLEELGATIHYEHQWRGFGQWPDMTATPPGWPRLRTLLGPHYFDKVVNVELVAGNRQWSSVAMALLVKRKLADPPRPLVLTDADFAALSYLRHLRGLKIIADLNVSPEGLRILERLIRLEWLALDNTSGRYSGGVTDDTLRFVNRLPRLRTLYLEGNPISDAGIAQARWPVGLSYLNLSGTKITDAGLARLAKIPALRELVVMDCAVTPSGIKAFRRALPKCAVRAARLWGQ